MVQGKEPAGEEPKGQRVERRNGAERRRSSDTRRKNLLPHEPESPQAMLAGHSAKPVVSLRPADLASALLMVIDKLNRGAMLIDGRGRVHALNSAARKMAATGDAFRVSKGCLNLSATDQQRRLEQFLAAADREQVLALKLERKRHRPPYRILVSSLPPVVGDGRAGHLFAVFIYQPGLGNQIPDSVLRELYGLSPAESRLVIRLFQGESLNAAAASLGIATNTGRSHLKRVFSKCEVQTQAELLQLLSLGPRTS